VYQAPPRVCLPSIRSFGEGKQKGAGYHWLWFSLNIFSLVPYTARWNPVYGTRLSPGHFNAGTGSSPICLPHIAHLPLLRTSSIHLEANAIDS
jgi:hypothetical protein